MALNVALAVYHGVRANLVSLASTGHAGVLAYATDSNELFVDTGTGSGIGTAWLPIANDIAVFSAASQSAMVALSAKVGDLCDRTDLKQIFILTAYPASSAGNWVAISPDASVTGIQGLSAGVAHEWVSYIDTAGVQHLTQPSFVDISGSLSQTQLPATIGAGSSLTVIDCGTF
jgi:hypothetical protein